MSKVETGWLMKRGGEFGTELPFRFVSRESRFGGAFMIFWGLGFAAIPLTMGAVIVREEFTLAKGLALGFLSLFVLGGIFAIRHGIGTLRYRATIEITQQSVTFAENEWRQPPTVWNEPISAYDGVLVDNVYHSSGERSSGYTEYRLHLHHATTPARTLQIWSRVKVADGQLDAARRFARLFALPVLEASGDGQLIARDAHELAKTLAKFIAEGEFQSTHQDGDLSGLERFSVDEGKDGALISAPLRFLGWTGVIVVAMGSVIGAAMAYEGRSLSDAGIFWAAGAVLMTLGFLGRLIVRLDRHHISTHVRCLGFRLWARRTPTMEIRNVRVKAAPHRNGGLRLEHGGRTHSFGFGWTSAELDTVYQYILWLMQSQ